VAEKDLVGAYRDGRDRLAHDSEGAAHVGQVPGVEGSPRLAGVECGQAPRLCADHSQRRGQLTRAAELVVPSATSGDR
jgi:hypothetical protein